MVVVGDGGVGSVVGCSSDVVKRLWVVRLAETQGVDWVLAEEGLDGVGGGDALVAPLDLLV